MANNLNPVEKREEVVTYRVTFHCCACGGMMKFTGRIQPMSPPNYHHECEVCGGQEWTKARYPFVEYVPKEPGEQHTGSG